MASEPENTYYFLILPKHLSEVQIYVWYGETRLSYNIDNCTILGNYLCLDTQQGMVSGTMPTAVEISSSGYTTKHIDNPSFNEYGNCYVSLINKLYGWQNGETIVYTTSTTPSSGDRYYNNEGKAYDLYELIVDGLSLFGDISSYNSENDQINIYGDPA